MNHFAPSLAKSRQSRQSNYLRLAALTGSLALAATLTGCSMGTAPTNAVVQGAALNGVVHGGQQPITGATIQLYQVGTTGYGTGAAALLTSAVTTDASGSFSITGKYTCPNTTTLVYITATGGNPGGGANANSKLMAALGPCGNLTSGTYIFMDEVTTAAAAFALTPYFSNTISATSIDGFGSPNTTQAIAGITNAFTTAATLASTTTGNANATLTTNGAGGTLTITPEAAKLYTIADVLAACVNTTGGTSGDGTACGTLFADSGPTGVTPVNTLQAAVLLNRNPTSSNANGSANNLTALYGLISPTAPYVAQAAQPTDWTVGVAYTGTAATMAEPQSLAIDATGNVWVVNNTSGAGGSLNEITPGGSMAVFSTLTSGTANAIATNPRNLAIDLNGNVWVPTSSSAGNVFEYTPSGTVNTAVVGKSPYGVAIDASNNVWFSQESTSAVTGFTEFLAGNLASTSQVTYPVIGSATTLPSYLAFDANGNLWASSGANLASATNVTLATGLSSASCTAFPCTTGAATYTNVTGLGTEPFGIAASATSMWIGDAVGNSISNVTLTTPTATNYGNTSSVSTPRWTAVDGGGNIWVSNRGTGGISEFSSNGTVLSPVPATGNTTPVGYLHSGLTSANQLAIDPSGNVWVADNTVNTNAYTIFEIVGAAAPTVTPTVLALKNNTIGVKP